MSFLKLHQWLVLSQGFDVNGLYVRCFGDFLDLNEKPELVYIVKKGRSINKRYIGKDIIAQSADTVKRNA